MRILILLVLMFSSGLAFGGTISLDECMKNPKCMNNIERLDNVPDPAYITQIAIEPTQGPFPKEFERVVERKSYSPIRRLKVYSGWIVVNKSEDMIFISDPNHLWSL